MTKKRKMFLKRQKQKRKRQIMNKLIELNILKQKLQEVSNA